MCWRDRSGCGRASALAADFTGKQVKPRKRKEKENRGKEAVQEEKKEGDEEEPVKRRTALRTGDTGLARANHLPPHPQHPRDNFREKSSSISLRGPPSVAPASSIRLRNSKEQQGTTRNSKEQQGTTRNNKGTTKNNKEKARVAAPDCGGVRGGDVHYVAQNLRRRGGGG